MTIYRLLDIGEVRLASDEYFNLGHEWRRLDEDKTFTAGQVQKSSHHPVRRRETVLLEGELSRDQFAAQALEGLCAQTETIRKAIQFTAGAGAHQITDWVARLAYEFADAMKREGKK